MKRKKIVFVLIISMMSLLMTGCTVTEGEVMVDLEEEIKYKFELVETDGNERFIWLKEDEKDLKEEYVVNFVEILSNYYEGTEGIIAVFLTREVIERDLEIMEAYDDLEPNFEEIERMEEEYQEMEKTDYLIHASNYPLDPERKGIRWTQREGEFSHLEGEELELNEFETEDILEEDIIKRVMEE